MAAEGNSTDDRGAGEDGTLRRHAECAALSASSLGVGEESGQRFSAETENISANGVLFAMDNDVPVGSMVDFTILLAGRCCGCASQDVQIDCRGRVVRSFEDRGRRGVGVVIDEYHFERA